MLPEALYLKTERAQQTSHLCDECTEKKQRSFVNVKTCKAISSFSHRFNRASSFVLNLPLNSDPDSRSEQRENVTVFHR